MNYSELGSVVLYSLPSTNISRFDTNIEDEEYYNFQFTHLPDTLKQETLESTTTCNICNIDVVSRYFTDHEESFKHLTQLKITNSLSKRYELYLSEETKSSNTSINNDSEKYCSICNLVYTSSWLDHLSSDEHKDFLAQDNILHEYYTLFVKSTDENEIKISLQNVFHDLSSDFNNLELCTKIDVAKQQYLMELEESKNYNITSDLFVEVFNINNTNISDKNGFNSFESVKLKKNINLVELKETKTKFDKNKNVVKLNLDKTSEHELKETKNVHTPNFTNIYTCTICNVSMLNSDRIISEHNNGKNHIKMTKKHLNDISSKLINNKCLKEPKSLIKNNKVHNDNINYICKICNVSITNSQKNIDEHKLGKHHKTMIKKKPSQALLVGISNVIKNKCSKSDIKSAKNAPKATNTNLVSGMFTCPVCKVPVTNNKNHINAHNLGKKHKEMTAKTKQMSTKVDTPEHCKQPTSVLNKPTDKKSIDLLHKQLCASSNLVTMQLNKNYHGTLQNINDSHLQINKLGNSAVDNECKLKSKINDKSIVNNYTLKSNHTVPNKLSKIVSEDKAKKMYTCLVCNISLKNDDSIIYEHNNGKKHKKMTKAQSQQAGVSAEAVIEKTITKSSDNGISNDKVNKDFENMSKEINKKIVSEDKAKMYTCLVCNISLKNDDSIIDEHNNGKKHIKMMISLSQQAGVSTETVIEKTITKSNDNVISNDKVNKDFENMSKEINKKTALSIYTCSICNLFFPNDEMLIDEHNKESNHIKMMKQSHNSSRSSKSILEENITVSNEDGIKNVKQKEDNISNIVPEQTEDCVNKMYTCTICNVSLPNSQYYIDIHNNGKNHIKMTKKQPDQLDISSNIIKNDCLEEIKSLNHGNLENTMLSNEDRIKFTDAEDLNKLNPNKVSIDNNVSLMSEHTIPTKTSEVVSEDEDKKTYSCSVCNITLKNLKSIVDEHNNGKKHLKMIIEQSQQASVTTKTITEQNKSHNDKVNKSNIIENVPKDDLNCVNNIYTCIICNVSLSNSQKIIDEHNSGKKHIKMTKTNQALLEASGSLIKNKCIEKVEILEKHTSEEGTLNNDDNNISKTILEHVPKEIDINTIICPVCEVPVPNNEKNINEHNLGKKHNEIKATIKLSIKVDSSEHFMQPNSVEKKILAASSHETGQSSNDGTILNTKKDSIIISENYTVDNKISYKRCLLCDLRIPNNAKDLMEHDNSILHIDNRFNDRLRDNYMLYSNEGKYLGSVPYGNWHGIFKDSRMNRWFCLLCNSYLYNDPLTHLFYEKHKALITHVSNYGYRNVPFGYHCVECNKVFDNVQYHLHNYHYRYSMEKKRKEQIERQKYEEMEREKYEEMERQKYQEMERQKYQEMERQKFEEMVLKTVLLTAAVSGLFYYMNQ